MNMEIVSKIIQALERKYDRVHPQLYPESEDFHPIITGDWNGVPRDKYNSFEKAAEKQGIHLEWDDEWDGCCECGQAINVNPDHMRSPKYIHTEFGHVCKDCVVKEIEENGIHSDYLEMYRDNPDNALPNWAVPLVEQLGYTKRDPEDQYSDRYQTGLHRGMNDDPKEVQESLHSVGEYDFVFAIDKSTPFYLEWSVLVRENN